jgi:branched-chain amino acid aminotransferase
MADRAAMLHSLPMVTTFEITTGQARGRGQHATMRAATADLPPGAYTTMRTYHHNRLLRLGQHLRRLEESAALLGEPASRLDDTAVGRSIGAILGQVPGRDQRFRLIYAPPRLFVLIEPFPAFPPSLYDEGVWCVTTPLLRENPHAKSTAFIAPAAAALGTLPEGAHEALMVAADGAVLEGLSSNFFAVTPPRRRNSHPAGKTGTVLRTEGERVLMGVTRSLVIEVAAGMMPLSTVAVHHDELPAVRECFLTSTSREIMPVVKVDQCVIGGGRPGPITRELLRRFRALVEHEAVAVG